MFHGAHGARRMAERGATVQSRVAEPVGRAETPDGRIRLTFSFERGLPELHIGPEAMRMDARELAETIQRLVSEALKDLADRSDNRP